MKRIDNLELFEFSLDNPEPIIDDFYLKHGSLVISEDPKKPTELMQKNFDLIEAISAYSFAKKKKDKSAIKKAIEEILKIVKNKNINYSEFVSFWSVVDISYSLFMKMIKEDQFEIIKKIIDKYIELRHGLYTSYGYTSTTLQVGKDAKAHKESGNLGLNKVSKILEKQGFKNANTETAENFNKGNNKYIESDHCGKKLFKNLLTYYGVKFSWSKKREGKMPDFLVRRKKEIFIVEHKHIKEGGGGQNSYINEIISLIGFSEKNSSIHYVAFLDGIYFNLFTNKKNLKKSKISSQFKNIKENLRRNKQNYFVNTFGFGKLL